MVQVKEADAQRAVERVRRLHLLSRRKGGSDSGGMYLLPPERALLMSPEGVVNRDPRGLNPIDALDALDAAAAE